MGARIITLALVIVAAFGVGLGAGSAVAQERGRSASAEAGGADRARALERWRSMDEATRERMKARFERLQAMEPEERRARLDRARRFLEELDATERALAPEQREALGRLGEKARERVLRSLVRDDARSTATILRRTLTEEEQERLSAMEPRQRQQAVRRVERRAREQALKDLGRIGRELGMSPAVIREVRTLPVEERRDAMIAELRRRCRDHVAESGLPEGVSERTWAHLDGGSDEQFVRALTRLMRRDPSFGIPKERWERLKERRGAQARELAALTEPTVALRAERSDLPERALRRRTLEARRSEVVDLLARIGRLGPEDRARLEAADEAELPRVYRATLERLQRGVDGVTAVGEALRGKDRRAEPEGDAGRSRRGRR
ncbi:MAG: hypothetical protein PVJ89_07025 [Planctomycetota bacterium]|jgi:hypothetical protein